jgi:4-aminobutyrate aminotransferase-like enzyme
MDSMNTQKLLTRRQHILGNANQLSYDNPLHTVRGEGVCLYDAEGNALLDFFNNVPHVGHCHPKVVQAISQQAATLNTNTRYLYDNIVEYSEKITDLLPVGLDVCFFLTSGSEANDLAWRIATAVTGNTGGLVAEHAYHGITDATYALSPYHISDKKDLAPHVMTLTPCDDYRGPWKRDVADRGWRYAQLAQDAIMELADKGHKPAAFYMDNILSSIGIHSPPPGYLQEVYRLVRDAGGLCVADEVQSGFGRTGNHMWGFQVDDVIPDMVTFGKPIASGIPMGLLVTTREIADEFSSQADFFSTTGGNPVACAAALAVLDVISDENLVAHCKQVGDVFADDLRQLASSHSLIGDVRGSGLFIGVEMVNDQVSLQPAVEETHYIVNQMRDKGILIGAEGVYKNVLKIRPPLVVETKHTKQFVETLDQILTTMHHAG